MIPDVWVPGCHSWRDGFGYSCVCVCVFLKDLLDPLRHIQHLIHVRKKSSGIHQHHRNKKMQTVDQKP